MPDAGAPQPHGPNKAGKAATSAFLASMVLTASVLHDVSQETEGVIKWILTVIAAILVSLIPYTPPWEEISEWLREHRIDGWRRWWRRVLVWTVALLSPAALGWLLVPLAAQQVDRMRVDWLGCDNPTVLTMAVSPEDLATAQHLVNGFEHDEASLRFGCPEVEIQLYAKGAKQIADALVEGWSEADLVAVGPRPDLWWPGTARYEVAANTPAEVSTADVATSPVVLAVPKSLVDNQLDQQRQAFTWQSLLVKAKNAGWPVVRPDPGLSAAGEVATVALYASGGTEPVQRGDDPNMLKLIDLPQARALEAQLATPAQPPSDSEELLCRRSMDARLAFIVTEHQMVRYNTGRLMGACPSRLPPGSELVAFYPPDTLSATYPLVRLKWTLSAPPQRVQAERFETWLKDDSGKRFLNDAALRPPGLQMRDPLSKDNGALDAPYLRRELTTSEFDAVRKRRTEAQRPVRLLLALDASGSMLDRAGPDDTRFSLAVKGLERSLGLAGPGDQIGLWVFQGDGRPQPLAPVGPKPSKVWDALADVNPSGGTPLYLSIMEGVAALTAMEAPQYNSAVIVLTDGEDSGTGPSPAQMLSAVHGKEIKVFVAVTGTASCATQAIADVTSSTGGRCFPLGAASLDRDVVALFTVLWGGS